MSFVAKYLSKEGGEVRVLTALENGKNAWFVVRLSAEKYTEYKAVLKTGSGNIRDYGDILESGWGTLSEAEQEALKAKYAPPA